MKKLMKKSVALLVGTMALAAFAGMAQAETRFAVQDAAGTTDKMVVTDQGYIGVGTPTPGAAVNIVGPPGSVAARILLQTTGTSISGGGGIIGLHNNDVAVNSSFPKRNDRLGFLLYGTKNGTANVTGGGFSVGAENDWSIGVSHPTFFSFLTSPNGGTTQTDRMRITADGNIGISTTTPKQQLEVNGGIRINNTNTTLKPKPACDSTSGPTTDRGTLWITQGTAGTKDSLEVCLKDGAGNYAWRLIY